MNDKLSPQDQQAGLLQAASVQVGLGQAVAARPAGTLDTFISSLQKHNSRLNELVLLQRDHCVKVTGNNPIEDVPPTEKPVEPVGTLAEFYAALEWYEELLKKLNNTTEAWLTL